MGGWAIAVHGGAGVDPNLPQQRQEEAKQLLNRCLNLGIDALRSNLSAVDVVELVVRPFLSVSVASFSVICPVLFSFPFLMMLPCGNFPRLNPTKEIKTKCFNLVTITPMPCLDFLSITHFSRKQMSAKCIF